MQTPGEAAARDSLDQSMSVNRVQVALAGETIQLLRADIREAVREGISAAVEDMQRQAAEKTGAMVGGILLGVLKKGALFTLLGGIVYSIGGWSALAGLFKILSGEK